MSLQQVFTEDQRRLILEMLAEDSDYANNENTIKTALKYVGHNISSDKLATELHWLQEQELVDLNEVAGMAVAKLTQRGLDVANGASSMPGVARKGL